jgi:hypothetical protein
MGAVAMKRPLPAPLSVIVPYRDRSEQLTTFLRHMTLYFQRDKIDRHQPYRILVIEQEAGRPFNAGALRNAGFLLTEADSGQVCFHDVDYLPIWADYRPVDGPTRLLWHGAEEVPIPGSDRLVVGHDRKTFFGGVVMFPTALFRRINGYSNGYWGWGYEDTDIRMRCRAEGLRLRHRDGTFNPLQHASHGYETDGKPTETHHANRALCYGNVRAMRDRNAHREEGLNSLRFEILARDIPVDEQGEPYPHTERVLIRI